MANAEHKLKIVHLMNIFRRETDAQHPISMSEIKKKLAKHLSNHEPDRKAIYDDFDALEAYGFIVHREPNGKRYYLENPDFTYNEVRMIADCVSASKFLSERQARNLIEKLKGLCTVYDSSKLTRQVVVQNRTRTDNDESRDELDKIFQAINERKQISYSYFDYDLRKQRKRCLYFLDSRGTEHIIRPECVNLCDLVAQILKIAVFFHQTMNQRVYFPLCVGVFPADGGFLFGGRQHFKIIHQFFPPFILSVYIIPKIFDFFQFADRWPEHGRSDCQPTNHTADWKIIF